MPNANNHRVTIIKFLTTLVISLIGITACASGPSITTSEALINSANRTLNTLKNRSDLDRFNSQLKTAAGVAIFPSIYKVDFFVVQKEGMEF